jgi:hypothetical protein
MRPFGGGAAFTPLHRAKAMGYRIVDDIRMLKRPEDRAPGECADAPFLAVFGSFFLVKAPIHRQRVRSYLIS